jgi:hypothetical protein
MPRRPSAATTRRASPATGDRQPRLAVGGDVLVELLRGRGKALRVRDPGDRAASVTDQQRSA